MDISTTDHYLISTLNIKYWFGWFKTRTGSVQLGPLKATAWFINFLKCIHSHESIPSNHGYHSEPSINHPFPTLSTIQWTITNAMMMAMVIITATVNHEVPTLYMVQFTIYYPLSTIIAMANHPWLCRGTFEVEIQELLHFHLCGFHSHRGTRQL